jgi:uncharacterized membrane protein
MHARPTSLDLWLVAIVAGGAVLRFVGIGTQSLWYDEYVTSIDIRGSIVAVMHHVAHLEGTPPLYYALLWGWTKIFGTGDAALRSLSAVAGIATIAVVYAIARELDLSRRVARVAAVLIAVNPMLIWYSQEARAYSLFTVLTAVSFLFAVRAWHRRRTADLVWWALFSIAAVTTHYYGLFFVGLEFVCLVACLRGDRIRVVLAAVPVGIVSLALVPLVVHQRHFGQQTWIATFPLPQRLAEAGRNALAGPSTPSGLIQWLVAAAALGALLLLLRVPRRERRVALGIIAFGVAVVLASTVLTPAFFLGRNVIAVLVMLAVGLAVGLGASRPSWPGLVLTLVICVASIANTVAVATTPSLQKSNWKELAHGLQALPGSRVLVVNYGGYLATAMFRYLHGGTALNLNGPVTTSELDFLVHVPRGGTCGRWSGLACESYLDASLPPSLATRFTKVGTDEIGGFTVDRYRAASPVTVPGPILVAPGLLPTSLFLRINGPHAP